MYGEFSKTITKLSNYYIKNIFSRSVVLQVSQISSTSVIDNVHTILFKRKMINYM